MNLRLLVAFWVGLGAKQRWSLIRWCKTQGDLLGLAIVWRWMILMQWLEQYISMEVEFDGMEWSKVMGDI